jgi:hypothetical protein
MAACGKGRPCGAWKGEPDGEHRRAKEPDRDSRAMSYATAKGAGRARMAPRTPGGHRDTAWGGALRRVTDVGVTPSREDEQRYTSIPGRYVPIGFARYVPPTIDPYDYEYYRVAGWRVAIPRATSGLRVKDILYRIFYYGPQSAGFVRVGDTLVEAILEPGDRMTLANSTAGDDDSWGLGP